MRNDTDDHFDDRLDPANGRIEPQLDRSAIEPAALLDSPMLLNAEATVPRRSNKAIGALSALTLAILCSSAAFGWWSMQRMQLLAQQLIATQDSFSKTSEDAASRINEITGKVSITQSAVLSDNETLKLRLNALENSRTQTAKQQQISLTEYDTRITQLTSQLTTLSERTSHLQTALDTQQTTVSQRNNALSAEQTLLNKKLEAQHADLQRLAEAMQSTQQQLTQVEALKTELKSLSTNLAALQKNNSASADITRLQQDILILRSELEQQSTAAPAPAAVPRNTGPSLADFDAYRAQTHRTISALQEQVRALQKSTP